ncbi:hypothetical protein OXYTRIMIC_065 [Oxytricha trifallax]|uniref:Uncharacterized protein n=1 Tax=Oxytricha trifallax TaxID=1172189 RepID=A0A073HXA1_9SPIT|nr:hypothetical protein OXYTRIMIC_065 [Oxytricha trifallax]
MALQTIVVRLQWQHISVVHKGSSAYLIKQSTKRKARQPVQEEEKIQEANSHPSKRKFMDQNKRVRDEMGMMKNQIDDLLNYKSLVLQLHEQGVIDGEGKVQGMDPTQQNTNFMI